MAEALTIRPAEPADCARLTAIAHAAKRYWRYPEDWIRLWAKDLTVTPAFLRDHPTYLAVDGGEIIGFYALKFGGETPELEHLWVTPERIGRGVGAALFRHAARETVTRGARALRITADPNAEAFYIKHGAQRIGEVPSTPAGRRLPLLLLEVAP